jgi:hypothetical protein
MIKKDKTIRFQGFKTSSSVPTAEQVTKINQFTRRQFTAEELYVGQLRLAHNAIDRDNERFSEGTLQGFADTAVRKTMLFDHRRDIKDNAIGKFFDVEIEKLPLIMASAELAEELKLPEGMNEVMIMSPWFYIPKRGVSEEDIVKIDAGIFDFASIGFNAENYVDIMDNDGNTLFYEYRGKGEMREGSLVYLGAQQGMSVKSADNPGDNKPTVGRTEPPDADKSIDINKPKTGGNPMKDFLKKLGTRMVKTLSEDNAVEEIMAFIAEKDAKIKELEPQAADGAAYRKGLVEDAVKFGVMIDEIKSDAESQETERKYYSSMPIDRLKVTKEKFELQARKMFPANFEIPAKDEADRQQKGAEATQQGGKESPLVADAKKRAEAQKK